MCASGGRRTFVRRRVFRAAGVGCLASILNGRSGWPRASPRCARRAPEHPAVPALVAAEVPIITVEVALAAIFSFTLISPLGLPWWVPVIAVAVVGSAVVSLSGASRSAIASDSGRAGARDSGGGAWSRTCSPCAPRSPATG